VQVIEPVAAEPRAHTSLLVVAGWWALTLLLLLVLDDLVLGPVFWSISVWKGPVVAVALILVTYIPVQMYFVLRATTDDPGRVTTFYLGRLDVHRRSAQVQRNTDVLSRKVGGATSAVLLSPLVGGVLPCLVLWRQGHSRRFVCTLALTTSTVFALVYAALHGLTPHLITTGWR
jgi:hypothetical protein